VRDAYAGRDAKAYDAALRRYYATVKP